MQLHTAFLLCIWSGTEELTMVLIECYRIKLSVRGRINDTFYRHEVEIDALTPKTHVVTASPSS